MSKKCNCDDCKSVKKQNKLSKLTDEELIQEMEARGLLEGDEESCERPVVKELDECDFGYIRNFTEEFLDEAENKQKVDFESLYGGIVESVLNELYGDSEQYFDYIYSLIEMEEDSTELEKEG